MVNNNIKELFLDASIEKISKCIGVPFDLASLVVDKNSTHEKYINARRLEDNRYMISFRPEAMNQYLVDFGYEEGVKSNSRFIDFPGGKIEI